MFAHASGTTGLTPAAGGTALELSPDTTGQLRQHQLTGATIFGASSHKELETLAITLDGISTAHRQQQDHTHHLRVVVNAAVDLQIIRRLARQRLDKATDSSLGTQALVGTCVRILLECVVQHLVKQHFHRYSLGNIHIYLHVHNQIAEHMPNTYEPPLHDHMQPHLHHLTLIPQPGKTPSWVPDDVIYNDTGRAYHYAQPLRTIGHIRGSHANNTLLTGLQQELEFALYFWALNWSLLPVRLQKGHRQLILQQLPFHDSVPRWYSRKGTDTPPPGTPYALATHNSRKSGTISHIAH